MLSQDRALHNSASRGKNSAYVVTHHLGLAAEPIFDRHGNSRTTFEGGTARNVKCRTTFQQSAVGLSAVHPEE